MPSPQSTYEFQSADRPRDLDGNADADGPGFVRVSVGGELDLATAPKLGEALANVPNGTAVVILDLRELTFMDSSGLHLILNARARLADVGCRLVLVPGGHQIQRIFEITGTRQHLEFVAVGNAPDPAIVPSRTAAFALAQPERAPTKPFPLDLQRSNTNGAQSPRKGQMPGDGPPDAGLAR